MADNDAHAIGRRLRELRTARGWSLGEVERRSDGRFKAPVLGSYERGDRSISAPQLLALASFYGVAPGQLLEDEPPASTRRGGGARLQMNMPVLDGLPEYAPLVRYIDAIIDKRGGAAGEIEELRGEDLTVMAAILGTDTERLGKELRRIGALVDKRPPGT